MTAANKYLSSMEERLTADGCVLTRESIGPISVLVGYKAQMRALSRMHIFVVVAKVDRVGETDLREFVDAALNLAIGRKGQRLGMQSGLIVLPVLLAQTVDVDVVDLTRRAYRLNMAGFAALAQPAIVELAAGKIWTFRGTRIWGYAFNSLIRQKYSRYLPDPVVA
jgi:hypothetical protein